MNERYFVVKLAENPKKIIGPLSLESLHEELKVGMISWTDIGWSPDQNEPWRRLYEMRAVSSLMQNFPTDAKLEKYASLCRQSLGPSPGPVGKVENVASKNAAGSASARIPAMASPVYLQIKGSEHGPLKREEATQFLLRSTFSDQVYIWYQGLTTWMPVQQLKEFAHLQFADSRMRPTEDDNQEWAVYQKEGRSANRKGIVATIRSTDRAVRLPFGVCVDISPTGIQVRLESDFTFTPNQILRLELMPLSISGLPNLQFTGKVMWFSQEELRFGLLFSKFENDGWDLLKNYLSRIAAAAAI